MKVSDLYPAVENLVKKFGKDSLQAICDFLKKEIKYYNWVGFYFMNDEDQMLHIGPYAGAETEHTQIPYGKGICGQVAVSGKTFTVQDVKEQDNYIACSIETKAEIVVPIKREGKVIGQIDIDSHYAEPFTEEDEKLLEQICALVATVI